MKAPKVQMPSTVQDNNSHISDDAQYTKLKITKLQIYM